MTDLKAMAALEEWNALVVFDALRLGWAAATWKLCQQSRSLSLPVL